MALVFFWAAIPFEAAPQSPPLTPVPPATADIQPRTVTVTAGKASSHLTLRVGYSTTSGVRLPFRAKLPPAHEGYIALEPAAVVVGISEGSNTGVARFRILTHRRTPPGRHTIVLFTTTPKPLISPTVPDPGRLRSRFVLVVSEARATRLEILPRIVTVVAGQTSPWITLRASGLTDRRLAFEVELPAQLRGNTSPEPARVILTSDSTGRGSATFKLSTTRDTPRGTFAIHLLALNRELRARLDLTVTASSARPPADPIIRTWSPPSLARGTLSVLLLIQGEHFRPGATIVSEDPALRFAATRVLSPRLVETRVSVPAGIATGLYRVDVENPDGGRSQLGASLRVTSPGSLTAPVGVQTAAVIYPSPGTHIGRGEALYPRGLLAVSGSGSIVGTWLFDGFPFDRFVARATGGLPTEIRARMPLPESTLGRHRLQLAIESPQHMVSETVTIVRVTRRASRLRLVAPEHETVLPRAPKRFRWTLVPGAAGYEIELSRDGDVDIRRRVAETRWAPRDAAPLEPGRWSWRVCPIFPGDISGDFTEKSRFIILPSKLELASQAPRTDSGTGLQGVRWRGATPGVRYRAGLGDRSNRDVLTASMANPSPLVSPRYRVPSYPVPAVLPAGGDDAAGEGPAGAEPPKIWTLSIEGTLSLSSGDELPQDQMDGNLSLSGQLDADHERSFLGATGDLSIAKDFTAGFSQEPSRSWRIHGGGRHQGPITELNAGAGYVSPGLLHGAEILNAGLDKGGFEGAAELPGLRVAYYGTFDSDLAGLVSGNMADEQRIRAAAFEIPPASDRFQVRVMGVEIREAAGEISSGGDGSLLGLIGRYRFGNAHELVLEGGHGDFTPGPGSFEPAQRGAAYRLGFTGSRGAWDYSANLRHTEADFVNPANRGLTPSGISDRSSGDLSLSRSFGDSAVDLTYQHQQGGDEARLDGAGLTFSKRFGESVSLTVSGNLATTRANGGETLTALDQTDWGWNLSLSETVGTLEIGQNLTYQKSGDRFDRSRLDEASTAAITVSAAPRPHLDLSGQLNITRVEQAPPFGTTDRFLVTFQPSFSWTELGLTIQPFLSYDLTRSELQPADLENERFQIAFLWGPDWWDSFFSLQASTEWSRTRMPGLSGGDFVWSSALTLVFRTERRF